MTRNVYAFNCDCSIKRYVKSAIQLNINPEIKCGVRFFFYLIAYGVPLTSKKVLWEQPYVNVIMSITDPD